MGPGTDRTQSFAAFFRRYTKTWQHALATASLTAFGALAVLHRWFVALAVAAYVLPPIVLYATQSGPAAERNAAPTVGSGESDTRTPDESERTEQSNHWTATDAPTNETLHDVTVSGDAAFAVGAGGVVLTDDGDGWQTVLVDGPGASGKTLRGVDATDDGTAVWIAGDGGAVARLDVDGEQHVDVSAPNDRTDRWDVVAVGGVENDELVLLGNGSGEVLRGRYRDGNLAWDEPTKPGSGSSLSGIALVDDAVGYVCDTNDQVFETADGGESFRRIGIDGVGGTTTDVVAAARGDCTVSDDAGVLHRHDGGTWTPVRLGDEALAAVAVHDERGVACGEGVVYERSASDTDWERTVTSISGSLEGAAIGPTRGIAVGSDGAIVERRWQSSAART